MSRILIADDDPIVRLRMRKLAKSRQDIAAIADAEDGVSALIGIQTFNPDVIFLSVDLPRMSGFDVLYNTQTINCSVVLQSERQHLALKVFKNKQCNYLLKPFSDEHWHASLDSATLLKSTRETQLKTLREHLRLDGLFLNQILVQSKAKNHLLRSEIISHFSSREHITFIHTNERSFLYDSSLTSLEQRLDPQQFLRVHRNTIVNLEHIVGFESEKNRTIVLRNGTILQVSRAKWRILRKPYFE
jgi:two-component system LytT family response regulator